MGSIHTYFGASGKLGAVHKGWDGIIQALTPSHIIESGLPTEALLAQIAVSKYADGLPLYRQEGIYTRLRPILTDG